jgi:hypothetical protein
MIGLANRTLDDRLNPWALALALQSLQRGGSPAP